MKFDSKRPLSWSQLSCFSNPDNDDYSDPERWYRRYVLKEVEEKSPELLFGSMIDKKIQEDRTFLPTLPRYKFMQHKVEAVCDGIPLVGILDGYEKGVVVDFKTGKAKWDQKRIDKSGQLTMYALLLYLRDERKPSTLKFRIHWIPTEKTENGISLIEPCEIQTFESKREMIDVLKFMKYIRTTVREMKKYVREHE